MGRSLEKLFEANQEHTGLNLRFYYIQTFVIHTIFFLAVCRVAQL